MGSEARAGRESTWSWMGLKCPSTRSSPEKVDFYFSLKNILHLRHKRCVNLHVSLCLCVFQIQWSRWKSSTCVCQTERWLFTEPWGRLSYQTLPSQVLYSTKSVRTTFLTLIRILWSVTESQFLSGLYEILLSNTDIHNSERTDSWSEKHWLSKYDATLCWETLGSIYVEVISPISMWERKNPSIDDMTANYWICWAEVEMDLFYVDCAQIPKKIESFLTDHILYE